MNTNKIVLLLSDKNPKDDSGLYETTKAVKEELDEMGIKTFTLFTNNGSVKKNEDDTITVKNVGGDEITFNPSFASALMRNSAIQTKNGEDLVEDLEDYGVYMVNNLKSTKLVNDKNKFSRLLVKKGIATPNTKLIPDEEAMEEVIANFQFPAVFKTVKGSKGVGVFKIDKRSSAKGVLQALWDKGEDLLIQEYIKNEGDIRTFVMGNKIIGAMKRVADGKDFRNNVSQGASVESYELNSKEKKEILKAAKVSGCDICGVDHILTKDGNVYIIEVNSSPGTNGFSEIDEDIVSKIANYVAKKHSSTSKETILGYKEDVQIEGIGEFLAKLDTGNGRYSVLHGEDIHIENDEVSFFIDDKEYILPVEEIGKVKVGAVSSVNEKRPVVKLSIKLNGKTFKNEPFFITDRSDKKTPVLLSRALLKRAKVKIDPSRERTLKESLNKYKGIKNYLSESKEAEIKPLTDDALVALSVMAIGNKLPANDSKEIEKELTANGFINNKGKVTIKGLSYLKQPKMIVRLSKIGSR